MGLPPGQLANVANTKQQIAVPSFSVRGGFVHVLGRYARSFWEGNGC